jgi:hypothetical protein
MSEEVGFFRVDRIAVMLFPASKPLTIRSLTNNPGDELDEPMAGK